MFKESRKKLADSISSFTNYINNHGLSMHSYFTPKTSVQNALIFPQSKLKKKRNETRQILLPAFVLLLSRTTMAVQADSTGLGPNTLQNITEPYVPGNKDLYAYEAMAATYYHLNFNSKDFPHLQNIVTKYTGAVMSSLSYGNFQNKTYYMPYCVDAGDIGPGIYLNVEDTKMLTPAFKNGFNTALEILCKEYYDGQAHAEDNSHADKVELIVLLAVGGLIAGAATCCGIAWCCCNNMGREPEGLTESSNEMSYVRLRS